MPAGRIEVNPVFAEACELSCSTKHTERWKIASARGTTESGGQK